MKSLLSLLILTPLFCFAESAREIARDITLGPPGFEQQYEKLHQHYKEAREGLKSLLHSDVIKESGASPDIIAMQQQLELDIDSSKVYVFDKHEFINLSIRFFEEKFSKEELIRIREFYLSPEFKKLTEETENLKLTKKGYLEAWIEENNKLVDEFEKRSKEINRMTIEYLKSQQENTN